jgi:hypothetical protein
LGSQSSPPKHCIHLSSSPPNVRQQQQK